jgi:osmotically-inducible protein OsmY
MATLLAAKTDSEIQQDVLRELKWDMRVEETDVGVEVDAGVVTLSGSVSSWGKRHAAAEAAHRVGGVLDVANNIVVKTPGTPGLTDTEVARAVRTALEWDVFVPDRRIRSTVSDGVVLLEGDVDSLAELKEAERAVRTRAGVRAVTSLIEIQPRRVSPSRVRQSIEEALARRAQRESDRITFDVRGGLVRINGTVRSLAERRAVVDAATAASGVREIQDRLRVDPRH